MFNKKKHANNTILDPLKVVVLTLNRTKIEVYPCFQSMHKARLTKLDTHDKININLVHITQEKFSKYVQCPLNST